MNKYPSHDYVAQIVRESIDRGIDVDNKFFDDWISELEKQIYFENDDEEDDKSDEIHQLEFVNNFINCDKLPEQYGLKLVQGNKIWQFVFIKIDV